MATLDENNLFPEDYEDEVITDTDTEDAEPTGYKPGVDFDWSTGDFVRDGRNRIQDASGIDSWHQWCLNCLQTERYKHLAYSSDFGIELDEVFKANSHEEAESILTRQITEALGADPYGRTAYIDSLSFNWQGQNAVQVELTVVGIDDTTIDIITDIDGGGTNG